MAIRKATHADLDALVDIYLNSMPLDPAWNYRHPYLKEYPQDGLKYAIERVQEYIGDNDGKYLVSVIEALKSAIIGSDDKVYDTVDNKAKIVAFAIWEMPTKQILDVEQEAKDHNEEQGENDVNSYKTTTHFRDSSPTRSIAYKALYLNARENYMSSPYGRHNVLYLSLLCTHPKYFRKGYGSILLQQGIQLAKEQKWIIGLLASPMGVELYRKFGFEVAKVLECRVEGQEEKAVERVMLWKG